MRTTRRQFLTTVAIGGGGLLLGFRLGAEPPAAAGAAGGELAPNAWLRLQPDGRVIVVVGRSEMGQGVRTSLPMILAEELDVDFAQVQVEQASPSEIYDDLGTGGSSSVIESWDVLRPAGAAARAMLVAAAAARWGVDPAACTTASGRVAHAASGRSLAYTELLAEAAKQPVPAKPRLKDRSEYRLLGTSPPRVDGPDIVAGRARYGLDVRLPEMRFAVVARPPVLGGSLDSFDGAAARAVPGVEACFAIARGVAVVARSTWAAQQGRDALRIRWHDGPHAGFESAAHRRHLAEVTREPGITTRRDGAGRAGLAKAERRLEALYEYPFEAHAAIEPVNSTAWVHDGRCEIWTPSQNPNAVQRLAARQLGIETGAVTVHVSLLGGGFGRRLGWEMDLEAAEIASRVPHPVQLFWSRDDDLRHGYFQAAAAHRLFAGLDAGGRLVAWEQRKASTPHNARSRPTAEQLRDPDQVRSWSWGVYDNPYAIPDLETTYTAVEAPVPIGPWRAVFSPSSVFAREGFLDEIAEALGRDPLELRLELLGANDPAIPRVVELFGTRIDRRRLRRVLETAAKAAGWATPAPAGRARGIACNVFHTETYVAYVAEVSLPKAPRPGALPFVVHRVVGAVDCGVVIHRGGVEQQVESGIVWALSNMKTEVDGDDPRPHGLGEPTVCPLAPAVASALSRLVGHRIRRLPVTASDLAPSRANHSWPTCQ
jgi:isoquinoline 1-oxidoreductase beta subunit